MGALTQPPAAPSLIEALHSRYEAGLIEYNLVDKARCSSNKPAVSDRYFEDGLAHNDQEERALRLAILLQVPGTKGEAIVLLFHIRTATSLLLDGLKDDHLAAVIDIANDTLLDFMFGELGLEHCPEGEQLRGAATDVFLKRRYRTGVAED